MENGTVTKKGFSFVFDPRACDGCGGKCCNGTPGLVEVSKQEMCDMASFLGIGTDELIRDYLRKEKYRYAVMETRDGDNFACIFYDGAGSGCRIYPVRPDQCKTFPFWDEFRAFPEEAAKECPGITQWR